MATKIIKTKAIKAIMTVPDEVVRFSKKFWIINGRSIPVYVTGYECPPNNDWWWVPEVGYTISECGTFKTEAAARSKSIESLKKQIKILTDISNKLEKKQKKEKQMTPTNDPCVYCNKPTLGIMTMDNGQTMGIGMNRVPACGAHEDGTDFDGYACSECAGYECDECGEQIGLDDEVRSNLPGVATRISDGLKCDMQLNLHQDCYDPEKHGKREY